MVNFARVFYPVLGRSGGCPSVPFWVLLKASLRLPAALYTSLTRRSICVCQQPPVEGLGRCLAICIESYPHSSFTKYIPQIQQSSESCSLLLIMHSNPPRVQQLVWPWTEYPPSWSQFTQDSQKLVLAWPLIRHMVRMGAEQRCKKCRT